MSAESKARPSVTIQPSESEISIDSHKDRRSKTPDKRRRTLRRGGAALILAGVLVTAGCGSSDESTEPRAEAGTSASANPDTEVAVDTTETPEREITHASLFMVDGSDLDANGSALTPEQLEVTFEPIMRTAEDNVTATEAMQSMLGQINAFYNGGICDEEHFGIGINEESDATKLQRDQQNKVIYGDTPPEHLAEAIHIQNETRASIASLRFTDWMDGADAFTFQISGNVVSTNEIAENVHEVIVDYTSESNITERSTFATEDRFGSHLNIAFELTLLPSDQWVITNITHLN